MRAFRERKQLPVEPHGASYKQHIVRSRPNKAIRLVARRVALVLFASTNRTNRLSSLDTNTTVQSREPHPIAKCMRQDRRVHIAGADEDKGGEEAEQGGVGELEQRAQDGEERRRLRVRQAELVQVVHVCDAEVERGEEDDALGGEVGEDVEGDDEGAPDELFADGTLRVSVWLAPRSRG